MKTRKKLKILKFINAHRDWREVLSKAPYSLIIKDDGEYTIIKYNQLFSDFREQMVREARGLIVKKIGRKYIPVCIPFTKFFCVGDPNGAHDVSKMCHRKEWHITQKIDGSLIKLWYDSEWHVSTNGTIDAKKASLQFTDDNIENYYDLFMDASKDLIDYTRLDKRYTYMFELVGISNKVIVPYEDNEIYYLGRRNNYTLLEEPYIDDKCIGIEKVKRPKHFIVLNKKAPKKLLDELQFTVNSFTPDTEEHFEGYVISDNSLQTRLKMKSTEYMSLFHIKGNGIFTPKKILLMILACKDDDILSMFPEYKPQFDKIRRALSIWIEEVKKDLRYMDDHTWETRKEFAEWAKNTTYNTITFRAYGQDYWNNNWLENQVNNIQIDNLLVAIGVEDNV